MATGRRSRRVRGCRGHFRWPLAAAIARDRRATCRTRREARSNLPPPATWSPSIKDCRFGAAKWLLTIFDAGLCPMSRWNPLLHCSPVDSVAAPGVAGAQQLSYSSGQVVVSTAAVDKRSGRTTSTMDREMPAAAAAWPQACCRGIRQDRARCALCLPCSGRWRSACGRPCLRVVLATCWRVSVRVFLWAGGWGRVHQGLKHDEGTESSLFSPLG